MEMVATDRLAASAGKGARVLVPFLVLLFFAWGLATVLVDALVPKLKALFELNYLEAALTQSCFFAAYLIMSLPAVALLRRIGYLRSVVTGLIVMAAGCLLFTPAATMGAYWAFLLALFIMASGITLLQVSANPLMAVAGPAKSSHSRLTFAQFFNSFGTFVGPFIGAAVILKGSAAPPALGDPAQLAAFRQAGAHAVEGPFMAIALGLLLLAVTVWLLRKTANVPTAHEGSGLADSLALLRRPRLAFAVLSIFLYVGAEVAIGSFMTNYLSQRSVLDIPAASAHRFVAYYWGGAMLGRLIGGFVLRRFTPGKVLTACALTAAALALGSGLATGVLAAAAIIAVGLFNSIMFPTIFTLGIEGMEEKTPQASGLICMAIVGGAVVPPIMGRMADLTSLGAALVVPVACYLWVAFYGWYARPRAAAA
jgi:FHS family L-fucose permease-like MFS transporter